MTKNPIESRKKKQKILGEAEKKALKNKISKHGKPLKPGLIF
jgi:hypothetical protein